jgi:hypothetical protein
MTYCGQNITLYFLEKNKNPKKIFIKYFWKNPSKFEEKQEGGTFKRVIICGH